MSPGSTSTELSTDTSEKLAAERALVERLEVEEAALRAWFDTYRRDLAYRHELAWVDSQLRQARANIEQLLSGRPCPFVYHPEPPNPATMQDLPLAVVEGVDVSLVTRGTNGRGTPRVQLNSKYARYGTASKLTAEKAREFGLGLLEGADRLASDPPTPEPGTEGPQTETLAYVPNVACADLIEKGTNGRGKRRIALELKGCRYPISLNADEARTIGEGLIEAADLFEENHV